MAKLRLVNVFKKLGAKWAVKNLTLEVEEGELLCLLGPSGAGKTTTIELIAGLLTQDTGDIFIGDKLVNDLLPKDRDVAMVFQTYALYPNKTAYGNMAFPLRAHKMRPEDIDRRIKEIAKTLHIGHLLDRLPAQLSGGERQRVAIGRCLVRDPKVFLFDEPLTNLDAKLRVLMRTELKRLKEEFKITSIYATPDQAEALAIADRIAVMHDGTVHQCSTPKELLVNPVDTFVAGFIGSPPMNFINGILEKKDGKLTLDFKYFKYDITEISNNLLRIGNGEVIVGVRPQHISIHDRKVDENTVEAEVFAKEAVVPDYTVYLKLHDISLVCLCDAETFNSAKERVWISLDKHQIRIFDRKTEKSIMKVT